MTKGYNLHVLLVYVSKSLNVFRPEEEVFLTKSPQPTPGPYLLSRTRYHDPSLRFLVSFLFPRRLSGGFVSRSQVLLVRGRIDFHFRCEAVCRDSDVRVGRDLVTSLGWNRVRGVGVGWVKGTKNKDKGVLRFGQRQGPRNKDSKRDGLCTDKE